MVRFSASTIYESQLRNSNFTLLERCFSLLDSSSSLKQLLQIHDQLIISGLHRNSCFAEEIIQLCTSGSLRAKHQIDCINHAHRVANCYQNLDSSSWNSVIRAYATSNSGSQREAMRAFLDMRWLGVGPDDHTFPYVFKSCASFFGFSEGRQVHGDALKHGLHLNVYVQNTMIHCYGSCKMLTDAYRVFDEMSHRTLVSWNSMMNVNVECGWFYESVELFLKMRRSGFVADETTMVIALSACAELGNLSLGKWLHSQVIENGMVVNCQLGTALVDMYGKCGNVGYASLVFDRIVHRNVWTWSSMITGFAQHGFARQALEIFQEMRNQSTKPNHVTFLGVLSACSHGGLTENGQRYFKEMEQVHGIKPMMVHYCAMVDMLGRAGRLKEAYEFVMSMPIEADGVVWRALLSSCHIHDINDYGVSEKAREKLMELEPKRSGNLVMIANNYAEVGLWEKAGDLRSKMRVKGLKKIAGESCIEIAAVSHGSVESGEDWVTTVTECV
ncbi:pentatricopeptide repeat-containing protein At2g36730-like isoform X2 [Salvia splendens]|uniref:pentatricopeptide repeat-containing protein At2g36730-like isoform X2 n=1 Tax=Salvia splendens TaxID=180675 RepID=UPI001C27C4FF|nr:pentatricopeptide repeat-containing protein At2g36730-like isoform X2 [Salvia splendens]